MASNVRPLRSSGAHPSGLVGRFDSWAASYDLSQLQSVLYGPVHDAVLRYVRQFVPHPGRILDVGCGTGRLPARLASGYDHACIVGVDASTEMIRKASTAAIPRRAHFSAATAERLPFADAVFDLVVVTLSMSHWNDKAAGLAEIRRVMAPGARLVAVDICSPPPLRPHIAWTRRTKSTLRRGLPSTIGAGGFRVEHVAPIRSVALITDAALVVAKRPGPAENSKAYR